MVFAKRSSLASCLLGVLLVSCATNRSMTREEWLTNTQKTYTGVTKEELIKKAEEVLTLADGTDFRFAHSEKGFTASRKWIVYMVIAAAMGTDSWSFEVQEKNGKLIASVQAGTQAGSIGADGNGGTFTAPTMGEPIQSAATYKMFWDRLDYLLGKRTDWADCRTMKEQIKAGQIWGDLEHICDSITLNDDAPANLSDQETDRVFKGRTDLRLKYLKKYHPQKWEVESKKLATFKN